MMKKIYLMILFLLLLVNINAEEVKEINIQKVTFEGVNIKNHPGTFKTAGEGSIKYNIAYSSILPPDGIYKVTDPVTGKEAIIQIGYFMVNTAPTTLYLTDNLFSFFSENYDKSVDRVRLKLKFLGWGKDSDSSEFLDIQSLVVEPDKAFSGIKQNGSDKYYIQLGSYEFFQNSFPKITEMLPYLELRPKFYMVKYKLKKSKGPVTVYRVLAGPYNKNDAKDIVKIIKTLRDDEVFMWSSKSILKQQENK